MIKYRTEESRYAVEAEITPVEIIKETEKQVSFLVEWEDHWTRQRCSRIDRESKINQYHRYHDTWEAAHAHLMAEAEKHVQSARLALDRAKGAQDNVKGMKKP